ncbi:deoxycytidylate deaminase-like [Hoplias malabaricus]|uniref:deoxycytidylate deaminase-like n=1 Tax=Hoplias malabaricus TaxID=27720 RepID=UPI003462C48B
MKREDYLGWNVYFMSIAVLSAKRSKDPKTQVGACIVNKEKRIVGIGYNGMPNGCSDNLLPWYGSTEGTPESKHLYVCHAELNAIMNKNSVDVKGCTIYVTLFPCNESAKIIIQAGIKKVIYLSDKEKTEYVASKKLLEIANVKYRQFTTTQKPFEIDITPKNPSEPERGSGSEELQSRDEPADYQ